MSREVHVRFCESRGVRFPPATLLVVMVAGARGDAEALWDEVTAVLAPTGLHLAAAKTRTCHIDEGFDFLGFRIQRHRKRGMAKRYVYTYPAKKALVAVKAKVRALTRGTTNQTLAALCAQLNLVLRGWTTYFRHSVAKATFNYLCSYAWRRVTAGCATSIPAPLGSSSAVVTCQPGGRRRAGCALPTPPRSLSPGIATEEHGSLHHGRARPRHRHSPPAWARGEPDAWKHTRPVRRSGPGNQVVRKGDTAPRPDPYKAGPAGGRLRRPSSAGTTRQSPGTWASGHQMGVGHPDEEAVPRGRERSPVPPKRDLRPAEDRFPVPPGRLVHSRIGRVLHPPPRRIPHPRRSPQSPRIPAPRIPALPSPKARPTARRHSGVQHEAW
jgi:hypothetical protein